MCRRLRRLWLAVSIDLNFIRYAIGSAIHLWRCGRIETFVSRRTCRASRFKVMLLLLFMLLTDVVGFGTVDFVMVLGKP